MLALFLPRCHVAMCFGLPSFSFHGFPNHACMAGSVMLGALLSCGVAKPSPPSLHVECLHVYPLITCFDDFDVDIHIRSHSDVLEHPWLFLEVDKSNAPETPSW